MIRGRSAHDGLVVAEGAFSFIGTGVRLRGKAAFVNTKTGDTCGFTECSQWSPEVIAKLHELRALMEIDLGKLHLEGGGEIVTAPTGMTVIPSGGGGLGEHLGGDKVPQV